MGRLWLEMFRRFCLAHHVTRSPAWILEFEGLPHSCPAFRQIGPGSGPAASGEVGDKSVDGRGGEKFNVPYMGELENN